MTTYPHWCELSADDRERPDYLDIGRVALHNLAAAMPTPVRKLAPDERRAYDRTTRRNWAGRKRVA